MILTLFSSKKKFSHPLFCDWGTRTSVGDGGGGGGASSSKINNCPASLWHGLGQVVNHLRRDSHALLLKCRKQLSHICKGRSLCLEPVSSTRSKRLCLGLTLGIGEAREEFRRCCWRGTVWCCVLHGVWRFRVEAQRHTTFGAWKKKEKRKMKQQLQNDKRFYFGTVHLFKARRGADAYLGWILRHRSVPTGIQD